MPYHGLLHPELLRLWEAVDDPYLCRRPQTFKGRSGSVSVGPPVAHKVLFEPSEHLWRIWGLILNVISFLLPSCWVLLFALGCGISSFGGIQHFPINGCSAAADV